MNVLDHLRISGATLSYDLWLDFAGVPGRRRRELRRELRANLGDATSRIGSRTAVRNLGSIRDMATAANCPDSTRPHWTVGFTVGIGSLGIALFTEALAGMTWLDGAMAAGPENPVTGAMTFFPGSSLSYSPAVDGSSTGFSLSIDFGWGSLVIGFLGFILAAQPWRLLSRRAAAQRR